MRTLIRQLLAVGMCFGLVAVTCPLAAQTAAAPSRAEQKCCAKPEAAQPCCGTEQHDHEPIGCCVSHYCGNVISLAVLSVSPVRADAPQLIFTCAERITVRAHAPPVPPPRIAAA